MRYHALNVPFNPLQEKQDDQARFLLNLSEATGDQVELVAKEQEEFHRTGMPPMLTQALDNKYTQVTPAADPDVARTIVEQPYTAAYFQNDQMNLWNLVAKESRPLLPYDPDADYSNGFDPMERKRRAEEEKRRIVAEDDETMKQNAVMRDMMARFGDWRSRDDSTLRYWLNASGKATGIDTSDWDPEDFRKISGVENVEWGRATDLFGWQEIQNAYRMWAHPEFRPQNLANLDDNAPAYLLLARRQMLRDENAALRGNDWTLNVMNGIVQSVPLMTEMALTGGESAAVRSFMEMGYKQAFKEGGVRLVAKMLAKGAADAAKNGLRRLPFYAPAAAAEAYTDNYLGGFATMPDGDGGASIEVNDLQARDFFEGFISHLVQSYAEVTSEELGGLVPFGNVDATVLGRLVPKRMRDAFVTKIAWSPMTRRAFGKTILGNLPFHGFIGEFTEEELGNVMSFMATEFMQLLGAREENTPQTEGLLLGGSEAGETAASIMLQTLLFRGAAGVANTWRPGGTAYTLKGISRAKRESSQFDSVATTISETRIGQASVPEAKRVLDSIRSGDDIIAITPEDADNILLQATEGKSDEEARGSRETLAQAGITRETIDKARKDGTDLMLSANTLYVLAGNKKFTNAWDLVHKIRDNMVSEVFGKTTKELTADSFTKEQIDEMTDRAERQQTFLRDVQKIMSAAVRTAQKNAKDSGNKLGISQQNVRDFVSIYSLLANYLSKNVETEEGMKELESMVKNLSVQFAENPEKFDATAALAQVSPVWTGSAASYDQPSLQYVGTGEGAQVYGWGLYGSSSRSVAEWYAKADADRKNRKFGPNRLPTIRVRGEVMPRNLTVGEILRKFYPDDAAKQDALEALLYASFAHPSLSAKSLIPYVKDLMRKNYEKSQFESLLAVLPEVVEDVEIEENKAKRNLYRQTFWPDKDENLLRWEYAVSPDQMDAIEAAAKREGFDIPHLRDGNAINDLQVTQSGEGEFTLEFWLEHISDETVMVIIDGDGNIISADDEWVPEGAKKLSDVIGKDGAQRILDSIQEHVVTHPLRSDFGVLYAPYEGLYFGVDGNPSGERVYQYLEETLGSPKDASEFLYRAGIDGVTYIGDSSGARNYVAFSDEDIRVDEHILFQDGLSNVLKSAFLNERDADIRQAYPVNSGVEAKEVLADLAGKDIVNRDKDIPAQINRRQSDKLISSTAIEKSVANGFTRRDHLEAVANIEALYENAVLMQERSDLKNGEPEVIIRRFVAPIVIRGEVADAVLTQKESTDKKSSARVYSLELDELVRTEGVNGGARSDRSSLSGIQRLTRENSLPDGWNKLQQKHEKVKRFLEKTLAQGENIVKGQINLARFAESQEAIITLFKDADASTLPHESAHWLKAAMESLVGAGFATDKMKEDLGTINAWLDKQDYTGAVTDQDKYRAREEYFARAFEQYLREGRFPESASTGLKSALRRLGRMLQSIYRSALALNAPIDDSIRNFFNDIFTVEEVVDGTSLLSGILREINAGAITMNKEELANLESDIAAAKEDAESQAWLAALQAYQKGLREQRTLWRNEAEEAYADSKAEQAYAYVRAGHKLDENFLRNVLNLDEDTISILRKKRLTMRPKGTTAAPTGPATELTGDAAQFDALPDDAAVTLPADAETAQNVLAMLTHGMDGNGGPIWKRAKTVKSATKENGLNAFDITDSMKAGYDAALELLQSGEPVTKGGLIGYFATTAYNSIKNVYRAAAKQQDDGIVSLQETTQSSEGDTQELGDVTPDKSAPTVATGMDYDTLLDIMSDWTDTFKNGTKKAVAEIIYEFAAEGVIEPTNKEIWNEYKNRGFDNAVTQGRVESVIPSVKASREAYFKSRNVTLNQAAESVEVPADILATMNELGYADVGSLIADLRSAVGRAQFIKDYVNQKHAEYRSAFLDNPEWSSESGATRYLDALLSALKVTNGIKFSERVKIARAEAERELKASGTVRDIVKGERGVAKSLSSNAAAILKALKADEGDKAAAVTAALDMHRNAARLQAIRTLRAEIQKLTKRAQRIGKSKPGSTLDGDTINAVKSLLFRFRLSGALPQWTTGPNDPQSVLDVMKEFTPDIDAELKKWSPWMQRVLTGEEAPTSWENLTPDQFYELTDLIDYLRGEGHDSLAEQKGTFANAFVEAMDAILPSVEAHKTGDYTDTEDKTMLQKLGSLARSGIHQMKTLVFMAHLLDGRTEFYGDHVIGPVRKFFQLPLSEGASRELFWYQKVSGEVKPHILALMRSAKERKLVFPVNNEETRRRAYPDLHGEQAAFVLLNAGATENRARLMESFGWSEDELDGILRQFTKEDFEHAEAIWKALREMGTELAKVYFEERHYRMKWAELTPISLTLNDGTSILSEGGYYPLAYRYHDSSRGFDPDIMNPFTRTFRPTRPTATFARSSNLTDLSLLMSPSVIEQSIRENAHYIGMWQPLRMANAIWTNKDFKQAVIHNFGKETYDALKQLMDNVNNPDKGETGLWKKAAQKLGACLATAALGFKITTMAKQYASLTIGAERLGGYFSDAVSYALHDLRGLRREVSNLSPFMRDRYNLMDRDLKVVNTEFKKPLAKAADKYRYAAFWGLKQNDLNVAAVQWYAAYNWALDPARGMTKDQARAYADDFVATTQGAARTLDTPVVQLETLGRLLTPFFGPACAAANTRIAGLSVLKDMDAGERIAFAIDNFMVPGLVMALVAAVRSGLADPDDDDDWDRIRKQSLTALLTEPISGVPVVQDIADATVRSAVTGKPVQNGVFEVSLFRPAEQASRDFINLMKNWNNLGYSLYVGASLTGQLLEMPVVQVYEEYEKMYNWNFGDEDSKALKTKLKGDKKK